MSRRSGHLFEGYGGLSMAADAWFGTEPTWHSEIEPAAVRLLEHHYPDRPNLGDITAVEWADVEPVWLLTGGFPCQDVSSAGKRAGLRPDSRSGPGWGDGAGAASDALTAHTTAAITAPAETATTTLARVVRGFC